MKKEQFNYDFDSEYVDAVAKYTLQSVYRGALVKTAIFGRSYGVMKDLSVVREMVRNTNTIKNIDFDGVFYRLFGYYGAKYDSLMFYAKYLGNHKMHRHLCFLRAHLFHFHNNKHSLEFLFILRDSHSKKVKKSWLKFDKKKIDI